jgi:aspartyl/glutamyl-tRNA(Asn/Gln) amidotransferase C subunit
MGFQENDLETVLSLSQLDVSSEEKSLYLSQLQSVLDQMTILDQFDLSHVSPFSNQSVFSLRPDQPEISGPLLLSKNAPEWELNCFKVPKII